MCIRICEANHLRSQERGPFPSQQARCRTRIRTSNPGSRAKCKSGEQIFLHILSIMKNKRDSGLASAGICYKFKQYKFLRNSSIFGLWMVKVFSILWWAIKIFQQNCHWICSSDSVSFPCYTYDLMIFENGRIPLRHLIYKYRQFTAIQDIRLRGYAVNR